MRLSPEELSDSPHSQPGGGGIYMSVQQLVSRCLNNICTVEVQDLLVPLSGRPAAEG